MEDQIRQNTRSDRFTENTHGHGRGGNVFQQEIEHKLSADGGDQRQSHKSKPRPAGIAIESLSPDCDINEQDNCAEKVAQGGVCNGRDTLSDLFSHKKVHGYYTGSYKRQDISQQTFSADLKITSADDDAAAQGDHTAGQRGCPHALLAHEPFQSQGKQGLQAYKDRGAGNGCEVQGFEPEHIMQCQERSSRNDLPPLRLTDHFDFCPALRAQEKDRRQSRCGEEQPVKGCDGRWRIRYFDKDRGCGQRKDTAEKDQVGL